MVGSCFVENIGEKLKEDKFNLVVNPFGIVFNPISIAETVLRCVNNDKFTEEELVPVGERWGSFSCHSSLCTRDKKSFVKQINSNLAKTHQQLKQGGVLILTLGTAWVYERENKIVANCHKYPQKEFIKRLLSVGEIVYQFDLLIKELQQFSPNIRLIFTVSPVRHWKDGVVENSRSKSTLHLAILKLQEQYSEIDYFPAYEIVMDELRDYRFYKEDMLHPSVVAVDYIYERFSEAYFSDETKQVITEVRKLNKALSHRPFDAGSDLYKKFKENNLKKIEQLKSRFPELNWSSSC